MTSNVAEPRAISCSISGALKAHGLGNGGPFPARSMCGERHIVDRSQALHGSIMEHVHVFADEFVELQLTSEEALSVIRRQLTGSLAVAVAIVVFAVAMAL
jgi:hypothetical protein